MPDMGVSLMTDQHLHVRAPRSACQVIAANLLRPAGLCDDVEPFLRRTGDSGHLGP